MSSFGNLTHDKTGCSTDLRLLNAALHIRSLNTFSATACAGSGSLSLLLCAAACCPPVSLKHTSKGSIVL